jgi:hypothetical protein
MQEQTFLNVWLHRVKRSYIVITFICACIELIVFLVSLISTIIIANHEVPTVLYLLYYCAQVPLLAFIGFRILFHHLNQGNPFGLIDDPSMLTMGGMAVFALFFIFVPLISSFTLVLSYTLTLYEDFKNYHPRTKPQIPEVTHCEICDEPSLYSICLRCKGKYADEHKRVQAQLNRARQAGEPATLTLVEWVDTCRTYHWQCYKMNCETKFSDLEHLLPIGQGDAYTGGTTKANCRPICRAHNAKKSNRHPGDL